MLKLKNKGAAVLMAALCLLSACGGGGGSPEPVWTPIPDMEFRGSTPPVLLTTAGAGDTFNLECTITSHGYFAAETHLAIIAMQDLSLPYLQGHGLAIGRTGDLGYLNIDKPRVSIETWSPLAGLLWTQKRDSYLPPDKLSPVLAEDTPYAVTLTTDGYRIHYTAAGYDSGEWENKNTLWNMKQRGLVFANAFSPPGDWSLSLKGCRYRWSAR